MTKATTTKKKTKCRTYKGIKGRRKNTATDFGNYQVTDAKMVQKCLQTHISSPAQHTADHLEEKTILFCGWATRL